KGFIKEAVIWKALRHSNVLPFLGINYDCFPSQVCFVSPFMRNGDVNRFFGKGNKSIEDRVWMLLDAAKGLRYLHSLHITHGDIKGANILVKDDRHACFTDIGLLSEKQIMSLNTTLTSGIQGILNWMAPEVLFPSKTNSRYSDSTRDIYSFACTIFEIMTGKPPFSYETQGVVLFRVRNGERPHAPSPDIMPNNLWSITKKSWKQDPSDRLTSDNLVSQLCDLA
ncbi:kinase-like domain-containing protein, partial [Flagelloscypha sp. PMI_526]